MRRKARRVGASASEAYALQVCSVLGARTPLDPSHVPSALPASRTNGGANSGSNSSEPGVESSRSIQLTSRPSPPLEMSTKRSHSCGY